ncbi:uncharacterized protein B0T15DRAFT_83284 [Chaetomium strumarium]|uniref:Oxidoreductase-like protein n=1 Tax=Chaetomium strumarium TaxID=1170767 RepID=A0AAJ0M7H4_9PEZI|nr:hypothetical protein B0T15DRAFT_83284 [Chaetomium strumarium]
MARFFITGSSDGLGSLTAKRLTSQGHTVILHARNAERARAAAAACPGAETVLVADLSSIDETKRLAAEADRHGPYDAVIHNAGVYQDMARVPGKSPGLPTLFAVNTLAPYVLTCLMAKPKRLVFVASDAHLGGRADRRGRELVEGTSYADSKLHDVMLAKAFARRWAGAGTGCYSVHPGWVPTKMGGRQAPERIEDGVDTYVMLALGEGEEGWSPGGYFVNSREKQPKAVADDVGLQDQLLAELAEISGVAVPERSRTER